MSYESKTHYLQGRGSVSSGEGNANDAAYLMKNESVWPPQDEEKWAYSLVGRWWEVFWESSSPLEEKSNNVSNGEECLNKYTPSGEITQQSLQHNQQQYHLIQSNPLSHQQLSREILFDVTYETAQLKLVLETCGGKLTVSNVLEGAPNSHLIKVGDVIVGINGNRFPPMEQDRDCKAAISLVKETPRPMIVTFQRLQKYEAQHKITPALTSPATPASNPSRNDVSETKQLLSSIKLLQTHANTFLAKGLDEITIPISELGEGWLMRVVARKEPQANYPCPDRFFISPSGKLLRSIAELEPFLKNSSTNISTDSGSDDDDENIPLCVLAERQQKQQQHNKKRHCGKRNHTDDNSEDEEDAPDWYDAKIKSYNNGEFVVHFLGDEDDVTYTMPLKPSIVRPSTRAWGRRSLALLTFRDSWSCDRTGNSNQSNIDELIKNSTFDSFSSWLKQVKESLPPSTDLPDDGLRENSLQDDWGDRNTNISIGFRKIQEYRRLLVEQTKLCMRLSPPHNEDESCDDDDDESSDEKGPGPYADASYIDYLNRCLIAASEACEWLLNDSTLWDRLKKVSMVQHIDTFSVHGTGAKSNLSEGQVVEATAPLLSKENLQGIVVAGAKALHQILITCDLSRIGSVLSKQSQKVKRTTKRNRRLEINHETSYNGNISGERFGSLFATAPSSQESMKILITEILKVSSDVQNRNFIQSSILSVLSFMYENVWKPLVNWIETAEDMDLRKSDNFFSFEEVDFHKRAAENMGYLRLIDLSPWTSKLENKLRRARHFEVEAWSAIKACTQLDGGTPGISTNPCQDQCLLLLRRLKKEAATVPHGDGATGNRSITNLNPLGGQSISPQGVPISSSLTRAVIDDAIVTRAWVVDFIHAKTVRERVSFVEDVIRRYVTLPQLPALPLAFAGIGIHEVVSPSSVLAQNTKDSITILSANAYSYNHIIGNFASRLQTDFSLRNKSGISMALEELKKLPILSVIEEKLIIRDELIGWNDEALQMIGFSATYKCPFSRIESLHTKLMNILHGKTEGRERILQNIRYNEAIEKEVISFVVDDEETICPISGPWVRTQYKMGNEWKINSSSIIESLRCCGFFSSLSPACAGKFSTSVLVDPPLQKRRPPTPPTKHKHEEHSLCQTHQQMQQQPQQSAPTKVTLESISKLLEIHDGSELASSYPEEYKLLNNIKQYSFEWSSRVKQIVSSESLSIAERGNKLIEILAQKPVGVEMHPTVEDINLWCKVYSWLNNLNQGMDSLMDQFAMWKDGSVSSVSRFGNSEREVLVGLTSAHMSSIIEGQEFLTPISKNSIPRIVSELKDEILRDFDAVEEKDVQVISKKDVLESKFPMDVIMGSDEDRKMESPLFICQCLVWRLICDRFHSRIQQYLAAKNGELSSGKKPSLKDAKAILSFCPVTMTSFFPLSDIIILKVKKSFQQMVEDAEALQTRALQTLDDCTSLLQTNCFLRKDDICRSLQVLKNIQVDLVRHENSTIGALLNIDTKVAISRKVTNVEWLVKCFSYPAIFMENTVLVSSLDSEQDQNKIPFSQLEKLCDSIPVEPGVQWNETCGVVDREILRISHVVRNLFQSAGRWQSAVSALLPYSSKGQEMTLDEVRQPALELTDLEEIVKNNVLSKVKMPQMTTVRNVITLAREIKARLENELLCIEFMSTDVNKSRFPDDKSLVGKNGDFLLYRLTGSEIYACLRERLRSISETAQRLTVLTQEKLAFQWLVEVFLWVEEIEKAVTDYSSLDGYKRTRLFLNFKSARRILMKGENIFFNIEDVTKEILRAQKISIRLTPQRIAVVVLKGGVANSPGAHLLRWGALLYGCIKSDVDRAEDWEHRALIAIETYKSFSLDGSISHLGNATRFRDNVENLIDEAVNDLTIQNEEAFQMLRDLREKIECSDLVKKQMQIEQVNIEEEEFQVEIDRYENPRNVAFARFEVLDCILKRLPPCHEDDSDPGTIFDSLNASSIFEQSVRDKSRFFLEKSLVKGMETFGIESSQVDARGFCSLLAMNLENAIFDKFKSTKETISNEYRDKIRSLRFNLQDPKNPLLCARVLSEDIKIPNLIAMSSDELASKEIKQMRQQVKEESIKNVVISPSSQVKDPVTVDWGSRDISIDEFSNSSKPAPLLSTGKETPRQSPSPVSNEKPPVHIPLPVLSSGVQSYESLSSSADGSSGSTNTEFVRKPPFESAEPTRKNSSPTDYGSSSGQHPKKGSNSVAMTYSAPPALSPPEHEVEDFLTNLPSPIITPSTQNHGRHITSQSGTETFTITISRLKVSFTTKMFIERTCPWELNGFLPSDLADKGRISIEEFNKFISEKMKSGKWTLIHLKLSSIIGESNKTSYKRFYKEYESIDRICMIPVSDDGTKVFLVTPKFLRIIKCMSSVENLSRTNTYVVVLTKQQLPQRYQSPVVRTKGISNADSSVPMAPYGANL